MNYSSYIIYILLLRISISHTISSSLSDLTVNLNIRDKEGFRGKNDSTKRDNTLHSQDVDYGGIQMAVRNVEVINQYAGDSVDKQESINGQGKHSIPPTPDRNGEGRNHDPPNSDTNGQGRKHGPPTYGTNGQGKNYGPPTYGINRQGINGDTKPMYFPNTNSINDHHEFVPKQPWNNEGHINGQDRYGPHRNNVNGHGDNLFYNPWYYPNVYNPTYFPNPNNIKGHHGVLITGLDKDVAEGPEENILKGPSKSEAESVVKDPSKGEGEQEGMAEEPSEDSAEDIEKGRAEGPKEVNLELPEEGSAESTKAPPEQSKRRQQKPVQRQQQPPRQPKSIQRQKPPPPPSRQLVPDCHCGITNRKDKFAQAFGRRISGGQTTEPHEYPWQVALIDKASNKLSCGGSIISSSTILTAQHCTEGVAVDSLIIVVGEHNLEYDGDGEQKYKVKEIINYNKKFLYNNIQTDFALIILSEEITWKNITMPICLPEGKSSSYEDVKAIVTGWGSTLGINAVNQIPSPILKEAAVQTMNNMACSKSKTIGNLNKSKGKNVTEIILSRALCVFGSKEFACIRDSGGPLITKEEGGYYSQIGIVSWGFDHKDGVCRSDELTPGIFSRVTSQTKWIRKHLKGKMCSPPKN